MIVTPLLHRNSQGGGGSASDADRLKLKRTDNDEIAERAKEVALEMSLDAGNLVLPVGTKNQFNKPTLATTKDKCPREYDEEVDYDADFREQIPRGPLAPHRDDPPQNPQAMPSPPLSATKRCRSAFRRASIAGMPIAASDADSLSNDASDRPPPPFDEQSRRESSEIKNAALTEMMELERRGVDFRNGSRSARIQRSGSGAARSVASPPLAGTLRRRRRKSRDQLLQWCDDGGPGRRNSTGSIRSYNARQDESSPWSRQPARSRPHFWQRLASRSSLPDTPPNELVRREAFFLMSTLTCGCGLVWSAMYLALDESLAAIFPATYSALMTGCLLMRTSKGRYYDIVTIQLLLILLLPISLQVSIGGMVKSGGVMLWSFLCPMGAALFCDRGTAAYWFALYLALSALTILYEFVTPPDIATGESPPDQASGSLTAIEVGFFLMNICGSMAIVFSGAAFFASHLEDEFGRSEDLLQNILPRSISRRLKEGECHIVDNFDGVTILFADLVGFTKASSEMHPNFLVGMFLRDVFSAWDELCQWRGLEKIKTIGDAFMVVGGLAEDEGTNAGRHHTEEMVLLALEFQDALAEVNAKYGLDFHVRIGIHSGPVIAGVIGLKKFAFDVWGDAVNTASRMESHGVPGKIRVSDATYDFISHLDYLDFECCGRSEIKGKGLMTTYVVDRKGCGGTMERDQAGGSNLRMDSTFA